MATAITMPAVNGTAAAAVGANGASNAGGSHGTPDAHRLHHKDNAIEHWGKIETLLVEKQVVLFLDYDGTLSPIVEQPEKAFMKEGMRPVLAEAAKIFTTAIVTGRSKDKVYDFVQLDDVFYAGSHGLEIQGPQEKPFKCQMAKNIQPKLEESARVLHSLLGHIQGYEIEDNKFALSVHYRQVPAGFVEEVHRIVHEYTSKEPEIMVKAGKKVLELRPKVDWNKGSAVNWILDALDLGSRADVFPIYLGDDITDEDAFMALEGRSTGGMGILIKEAFDPERPPETHASFSLKNPDEVQTFLARLVAHGKSARSDA